MRNTGVYQSSPTVNMQSKQLLSSRVGDIFPPELVKLSLETQQPLAGLCWSHALHAGPPAATHVLPSANFITKHTPSPACTCGCSRRRSSERRSGRSARWPAGQLSWWVQASPGCSGSPSPGRTHTYTHLPAALHPSTSPLLTRVLRFFQAYDTLSTPSAFPLTESSSFFCSRAKDFST